MGLQARYERGKEELLSDRLICKANRELFGTFFEFEECKLLRTNGLRRLDGGCYKTLYGYLIKLRNVNRWFKNKLWSDLTAEDVKQIYDDLEDGRILNAKGRPFADRIGYYNKVFRSKPFQLAGKDELARQVMRFGAMRRSKDARCLDEANLRKLASVLSKPRHRLLLWLAWDTGENINGLLQLCKRDFVRQQNIETGEPAYLVNLPAEALGGGRTKHREPMHHPETVLYADMVLKRLGENDRVFPFGRRQACKILRSAVARSGAVCLPKNDGILWKDFRSSMACHLLRQGWSTDEIEARLGHGRVQARSTRT